MTAFRPGTSPPPVRMPMRGVRLMRAFHGCSGAAEMEPAAGLTTATVYGQGAKPAGVRRARNARRPRHAPPGPRGLRRRSTARIGSGGRGRRRHGGRPPGWTSARGPRSGSCPPRGERRFAFASRPTICGASVRNNSSTKPGPDQVSRRGAGRPRTGPLARPGWLPHPAARQRGPLSPSPTARTCTFDEKRPRGQCARRRRGSSPRQPERHAR